MLAARASYVGQVALIAARASLSPIAVVCMRIVDVITTSLRTKSVIGLAMRSVARKSGVPSVLWQSKPISHGPVKKLNLLIATSQISVVELVTEIHFAQMSKHHASTPVPTRNAGTPS